MLKKNYRKSIIYVIVIIFSLTISSCKISPPPPPTPTPTPDLPTTKILSEDPGSDLPTTKILSEDVGSEITITKDMLYLEKKRSGLLAPILSLKETKPKIYWFIVSWLETKYKTPDWTNYGSDTWQKGAKKNGIDCSGIARVMHDQVFGYKIMGSSQYILSKYSKKIALSKARMGDLVFFKRYKASDEKIIHMGVYLMDNYFVHATSTRSAKKGLGLNVSPLEGRWKEDLVAVGRVKDEFSTK